MSYETSYNFLLQKQKDMMFNQVIRKEMLLINWILALPWWIGLKQKAFGFPPKNINFPSLLISLNFNISNK
jgi:hypothetical protein